VRHSATEHGTSQTTPRSGIETGKRVTEVEHCVMDLARLAPAHTGTAQRLEPMPAHGAARESMCVDRVLRVCYAAKAFTLECHGPHVAIVAPLALHHSTTALATLSECLLVHNRSSRTSAGRPWALRYGAAISPLNL
jgi:hypothetical protein